MSALLIAATLIVGGWVALILVYFRPLASRWHEPVFKHPILVFESDDWGAGPLIQAEALDRILDVLRTFRDCTGRPPVMTLGLILEVPDTRCITRNGLTRYHPCGLGHPGFAGLRAIIHAGIDAGVFVPQLHGQCHYWPDALMQAARSDVHVRDWLSVTEFPRTEDLPPPLQSRWVDASMLPSRPLAVEEISAAVAEEAGAYRNEFGTTPCVAVPPTFIWDDAVEHAWQQAGVSVIITPGRRATRREEGGRPSGLGDEILTGNLSRAGQTYLVRDVYFEPSRGHPPARVVSGLEARTRQGRACLVEIHRLNFLDSVDPSAIALGEAVAGCLNRFPTVKFMAPCELAKAIRNAGRTLLETDFWPRLRAWLARVPEIPRFWSLARATGLAIPIRILAKVL